MTRKEKRYKNSALKLASFNTVLGKMCDSVKTNGALPKTSN